MSAASHKPGAFKRLASATARATGYFQPLIWLLFPFVVFGVVVVLVLGFVFLQVQQEREALAESEPIAAPSEGAQDDRAAEAALEFRPGMTNRALLMRRLLEARGGEAALRALNSVRIRGTMTKADSEAVEFSLLKKAPRKVLLRLEREGRVLTTGVSKERMWKRIVDAGGERVSVGDGGSLDTPLRQRMALFHDPAILHALDGVGELRSVERRVRDGSDLIHIVLQLEELGECHLYLESDSLLPVSESIFADGGGTTPEIRLVYDNWTSVDGIVFPFQTTRFEKGRRVHRLQVEEISINPFLLSSLFAAPEATEEAKRGK